MLEFGQEEVDAVADVALSGKLFRYQEGGKCARFEKRFGEYLGVDHVFLTASGSAALVAGLGGLGIGPGDEVLVPAHTYMATAIAVVNVGAIPVIVDIDESIAMDPAAAEMAIGPRTRAILAVHMWGTLCDMDRLGEIAARAGVHLLEDACQCVGGSFGGRKAGAIGDVGTFSFNYFKNITCGEGGAVVTNDPKVAERIRCMVDCCGYFWSGRKEDFQPFASQSSRASEFEGAMLNVQLDRIDGLIERLQAIRRHLLERIGDAVPRLAPSNCPGEDCGTGVLFQFERPEAAARFTENAGGVVLAKTGRHTYTEWDPILNRKGAHHPAMDPFRMPANAECRMDYSRDMCARSLDILSRTVRLPLNPHMDDEAVDALAEKIRAATA